MNRIALCVATMAPEPTVPGPVVTWTRHSTTGLTPDKIRFRRNTLSNNAGVVGSYQQLYESTTEEILAYLHDDVISREQGWDERVLQEFEDPAVGVVGFGGALHHGSSDLYKTPYRFYQLARSGYRSNVDDAEVHGERFHGECDVAVLDGFSLIVRRGLLERASGWSRLASGCDFFCYDYALCAMAHRLGYRVRLIGVCCHHLGGRTSVGVKSAITSPEAYQLSHRWFYDTYRDVMPWRCSGDQI